MYSFTRYLAAKKTVDDRALNQQVWDKMWAELPISARQNPLKILELGAGTGSMVERFINSNRLHHALYTALDNQADNITELKNQLDEWARRKPFFLVTAAELDLFEFLEQAEGGASYDLLVAHAFLDLIDLPHTLPRLLGLLRPGGHFYFTLNFDGVTVLYPPTTCGERFDSQVLDSYHATMDERVVNGRPAGDSQTGRKLPFLLRQNGAKVLAAGGSDWLVLADGQGQYPADEAYFLHHILSFFEQSLTGRTELNPELFQQWLAERHQQVERGELLYMAHQLDVFGQKE